MRPRSSGGPKHVVIAVLIGLILIAFTGVTVLRTTTRGLHSRPAGSGAGHDGSFEPQLSCGFERIQRGS